MREVLEWTSLEKYLETFVLALVDKIIGYLLLVGGDMYPMKLVKKQARWPEDHGYKKKEDLEYVEI